ncbi:MAG: cysteine--tRNA ligase [Candidatus Moraniibacteriota bacterium]|nr:MAG: cysteine--tRNA ligase [Candidatus Moranbacteria bacterium]
MLVLYNTLTKEKECFIPLQKKEVSLYTCGPTVYGKIHIGNIRSYLMADTLRRVLLLEGYKVRHIKNITDVGHLTADNIAQGDSGEDKIEKKAKEEQTTPEKITRVYEDYFHKTEQKMNILDADLFPKATEHIPQMISLIQKLLDSNHAYISNQNIFLDVTSFPEYGKLSGNSLEKLKTGARLAKHPDKKNPWDFALWLKADENHLMQWDSPWGKGYPGWHIECSAMSMTYLGESFDIHTGGEDNIFPHHEAEKAQSECATGKPFVKYWVHLRHLLIQNQKMSKSKGTLLTLEDVESKGFSATDLRLAFLSSHYRSPMNFTWESLEQSQKNKEKIQSFLLELSRIQEKEEKQNNYFDITPYISDFKKALEDDLNTPQALSIIYEMMHAVYIAIHNNSFSSTNAQEILSFWETANSVLGLNLKKEKEYTLPENIEKILQERQIARENKNYILADTLRKKIESFGYEIQDTQETQTIQKK